MPDIRSAGGTLHYEMSGSGDPVMLIAGLSGAGKGWGEQIEKFAGAYTTIVPDHPGTGGSSEPSNGYEVSNHAADMAQLIRQLGVGPTHIVGSSTGGAIAEVMALDHPDVVRSITLASAWARSDAFFRHQFAVRKQTLLEQGIVAYSELTALFLYSPQYIRSSYPEVRAWCDMVAAKGARAEVMAARIDMIMRHDQYDRLADINAPTLVVVGRDDSCTPIHLSEEVASLIPDSELAVLEGGHLIYKENPDAFFDRVSAFLSGQG
jgi:aminoacrylate hydrolase